MREEIAKWYFGFSSWDAVDPRLKAWCYKRADELLGILRGKIKAKENPYLYFGSPHTEYDIESNKNHSNFEDWRRDILALFSDGE